MIVGVTAQIALRTSVEIIRVVRQSRSMQGVLNESSRKADGNAQGGFARIHSHGNLKDILDDIVTCSRFHLCR